MIRGAREGGNAAGPMSTYWTLSCGGVEKSFSDWGFDEKTVEGSFTNMGIDVFSACVAGATVEDDPIFGFEAQVTIYRGRALGSGGYSGGVIEFQGKRLQGILDGRPEYEGVTYQFGNAWYLGPRTGELSY